MSDYKRLEASISGRVQGVFYRASTRDQANRLGGLSGWVRNEADGSVRLVVEGPEDTVRQLLAWCRKGPSGARVDGIQETWSDARGDLERFNARF